LLGWLLTVGLKVGLELGVLDIVGASEGAILASAVIVSVVFGKTLGSNDIVGDCVGLLFNRTEALGRSLFLIFCLGGNLVGELDANVGELLLIGFIVKSALFSDDWVDDSRSCSSNFSLMSKSTMVVGFEVDRPIGSN